MSWENIYQQFITDFQNAQWYEFVAVLSGIVSVWLSRIENIWLYPIGLINTIIYFFLSFKESLFGEAAVNFYYTVMSIYGWILWAKKNTLRQPIIQIHFSDKRRYLYQCSFFAVCYFSIYACLFYLKKSFSPGAIPAADAFASATAFTGMWLMTKKKAESWYWWIATNIASIPLYFVKHYVLTSVYYCILLIMAIGGLIEWIKKAKNKLHVN